MNSTIGQKITNAEAQSLDTSPNICAFSKENIVFTDNGYVNIDKLSVVDSVLTNDNTFEKVSKIEIIPNVQTLIVHAMGVDFIKCTPSQRFLVRENIKRISG